MVLRQFLQSNEEAKKLAKEMLESTEAYVLVCDVDPKHTVDIKGEVR